MNPDDFTVIPPAEDLLQRLNTTFEDPRNLARLEKLLQELNIEQESTPETEPPPLPSPAVQFSFDLSEVNDNPRQTLMPPIALDNETVERLQRRVRPGMTELARFGYSEPLSDPYGLDMRSELRKLVRSV